MKRTTARLTWLLAAAPLFLAGCRLDVQTNKDEVRRIAEAYEKYMLQLELAQEKFERENPMPQELEFGVHGDLFLRQCELSGRPGFEKLRIKYTFFNDTGVTIDRARVDLVLTDEVSGLERRESQLLELPFLLSLSHGSSYTSFFDMPLEGLHRSAAWSWRLELESERAPLPGMTGQ